MASLPIDKTQQSSDSQSSYIKATVVDNEDPMKKGRIKCNIPTMFEDENKDNLPWCYPLNTPLFGGSPESGMFFVPKVGSEIVVFFPFRDKYMPVYTGTWDSETSHTIIFDDGYPNSGGFSFPGGSWMKINTENNTWEFRHASGSFIMFDSDGSIYMNAEKNLYIYGKENTYIGAEKDALFESVNGNTGIGSGSSISINGTKNVEIQTGSNIAIKSGGFFAVNAVSIFLNNGLSTALSSFISGNVKSLSASSRMAIASIGVKLKAIAEAAKAKIDQLSNL